MGQHSFLFHHLIYFFLKIGLVIFFNFFLLGYLDLIACATSFADEPRLAHPLLPKLHIYHTTSCVTKLNFIFLIQFHAFKVFFFSSYRNLFFFHLLSLFIFLSSN